MIYILEGIHGGGKSTYAQQLDLPVKSKGLRTLDDIKQELEGKDNIVYDRLFGLYWGTHKTDEEIMELNTYFKSLPNLKCLMFICDRDTAWQRQAQKSYNRLTKEDCDKFCDEQERLLSLMDVFEVVDTTTVASQED